MELRFLDKRTNRTAQETSVASKLKGERTHDGRYSVLPTLLSIVLSSSTEEVEEAVEVGLEMQSNP